MSFLEKLKNSLTKTRQNLTKRLDENFDKSEKITDELYEQLEEILILADVGALCSMNIVEELKKTIKQKKIKLADQAKQELKSIIKNTLTDSSQLKTNTTPSIILILGVNGSGKTTTIAKLIEFFKKEEKTVLVGAADTFRAAAIEQLSFWVNRLNCPLIRHKEGADPAAVVFDTILAAKKRKIDIAICDTAGRLHNKQNLMNELEKIIRITNKEAQDLDKEILLTIDATTGQNAITQAKEFQKAAQITGTILTKLDGTSKGGIIIPIKKELNLPVRFIGTGETVEDLQQFDADLFTKALFNNEVIA